MGLLAWASEGVVPALAQQVAAHPRGPGLAVAEGAAGTGPQTLPLGVLAVCLWRPFSSTLWIEMFIGSP